MGTWAALRVCRSTQSHSDLHSYLHVPRPARLMEPLSDPGGYGGGGYGGGGGGGGHGGR